MVRTAIQLQTLEGLPESLPETIERVGRTPLEGVELFGLDGTLPNAVADALEKADLEMIGAHVPIGRLEYDYENVVDAYATIGCDRLIVPVRRRRVRLGRRRRFRTRHRTRAVRRCRSERGAFAPRGRIPLVHLTDSVPGYETTLQVELSAGELDVLRCVEAAREAGVEWLVYEHGMTGDVPGSLAHAATKLPMLSHGRAALADGTPLSTVIDDVHSISEDVL
ncbi:hypothetical protein [Halomontanus rarus]|uniref:hypothetical protein n=1 Tax=Halomontanus rarus TaxID=3034020 RepID=UPI001A986E15